MKKIIRKIVPPNLVNAGLSYINRIDQYFLRAAVTTKLTSSLYYLINPKFSSEHHAVISGRLAYSDSLNNISETSPLLRRNIHRLEKGLIMLPRKDIFGEGFIKETIECYIKAINSDMLAEAEQKWATDVLDEYFQVVGSSSIIDKSKAMYTSFRASIPEGKPLKADFPSHDTKFIPYYHENLPKLEVTYNELKSLFIHRRSVRWYQNKHVPIELIERAANIASFAPSACNRQPYRFLFCNDKAKTEAIAKCAMGTGGFATNLQAIIVVCGDLSAYPAERDRHLIYIDGSLASMQLMLALETLGLSSCPINWPDIEFRDKKLRKIINLQTHERVIMLLAVGYADSVGGIPYSQKKQNSLILEDISK